MNDLGVKFKKGLIWSLIGQCGYLLVTFVTNVLLVRLLSPKEFGVIAIAAFFIITSKVLTESGLSGALIRKKQPTDEDYSTIFIFNLVISIALYILLLVFSSHIELFYEIEDLSLYLRVLGLVLVINSFQIIQNVKLIKKLEYKKISKYSFISVGISSLLAIAVAFYGYGIWALIVLQVCNAVLLAVIYWIKEGGLKVYTFSKSSFKELYGFGLYTTLSALLNTAFDNIYQLILAKYFSINQTGFYFQAKKLTELPVGVIKSTTLGVVFSTLSNLQESPKEFDKLYNSIVRIFTAFLGLVCIILFLFSKEIIYMVYGEKWMDSSFYMQILIIVSFFYMHEMFNRILFKVFDKTEKILYIEIMSKVTGVLSIIIGVYFRDIAVLMYGLLITSIISYIANYMVSRKVYLTGEPYLEMWYTLKVLFAMTLLSLIYLIIKSYFSLGLMYNMLFIPFITLSYLFLLNKMKVVDYKKDLKMLKNI